MTLDTATAHKTTKTQVAIRTIDSKGQPKYHRYAIDRGFYALEPLQELTLETAKEQVKLYDKYTLNTIVVREVMTFEGPWEEVTDLEVRNLAVLLHKKQCHANHTDQCSWSYENNWDGYTHKQYAEKAKAILAKTSYEAAKELLEIL